MKVSRICWSFNLSALSSWMTLYENSSRVFIAIPFNISPTSHLLLPSITYWVTLCLNCSFKGIPVSNCGKWSTISTLVDPLFGFTKQWKTKPVYGLCHIGISNINLLYFQITIKYIEKSKKCLSAHPNKL